MNFDSFYIPNDANVVASIGLLSIITGIVIYFGFLGKKNEGKFKGFIGWIYDFLTFKKLFLEGFLNLLYIISAVYITFLAFIEISNLEIGQFLLLLIGGNIVIRVVYEFALLLLLICRNTSEINKKLNKKEN